MSKQPSDDTGRAQSADAQRLAQLQIDQQEASRLGVTGELAAYLAHELAQPLSAISNFASACDVMMELDPPQVETVQKYIREISSQVQIAGELLRRLRGATRRSEPRRERFDLKPMLAEAAELSEPVLSRAGASVSLHLSEDEAPVRADRLLIQQVALNLLKNACESVSNEPPDQRQIDVELRAQNGHAEVRFLDRGRGLDGRTFASLLDPFMTSKPLGLGFGLAVSKRILTAHRGELSAENRDGRGIVVKFTLPLDPK